MAMEPIGKRRKLNPSAPVNDHSLLAATEAHANGPISNDFFANASKWNLEQDYEKRPRKKKAKGRENTRLPIKTAEGRVEQLQVEEIQEEAEIEPSPGSDDVQEVLEQLPVEEEAPSISIQQQILEAKEELARIASLINEDPEEHVGGFRKLAQITTSPNATIKKLGLATQLAVFKDVIPGYRIRPIGEGDIAEKISKDVRRLRAFEQALVSSYQAYIKDLTTYAKATTGEASHTNSSLSYVAISCACALVLAAPHFNFRGDLLKILVNKLSTKTIDDAFSKCRETTETLFRNDEDGNASLDAVTLLTRMMKARNFQVDETVLNTFLHLRLLSEFSSKASQTQIDRPAISAGSGQGSKVAGKVRKEFRTKKQRKMLKERKAVEKEFKEADAIVSHEERDRKQADMLKLVFVTYFRILKARSPKLMGAVLEGLARYAHLINQDFFGDLLEVLKDLIRHLTALSHQDDNNPSSNEEEETEEEEGEEAAENPAPETAAAADEPLSETSLLPSDLTSTRSSLLCILTAFALLEGQAISRAGPTPTQTLNLDLTFFTNTLYKSLHTLSLSPSFSPSPFPSSFPILPPQQKINLLTPPTLLLHCLSSILSPRTTSPLRLAAFTKQLATSALQLPERPSAAVLALLTRLARLHTRRVARLWDSDARKADGAWDPAAEDPEGCNPLATTVWEGELLRCHFSPRVRDGVLGLEGVVRGGLG